MKFNIDFYRYRNVAYIFSAILLISSVSLFLFKNLNLGIDFKGGIMIEAKFNTPPNLTELRNKITNLSIGNSEIQEFGDPTNILIRIEKQSNDDVNQKEIIKKLKDSLSQDIDYRRTEFVGPKVGKELTIMGIKAISFSLLAMFAYIWFRLSGWQFGLGALIALFHDVISTIGFFSFSQMSLIYINRSYSDNRWIFYQ